MREVAQRRIGAPALDLFGGRPCLLYQVDLGSGNGVGGDERAVLGANEGQAALGSVGAILGGFQLALEAAHAGYALL